MPFIDENSINAAWISSRLSRSCWFTHWSGLVPLKRKIENCQTFKVSKQTSANISQFTVSDDVGQWQHGKYSPLSDSCKYYRHIILDLAGITTWRATASDHISFPCMLLAVCIRHYNRCDWSFFLHCSHVVHHGDDALSSMLLLLSLEYSETILIHHSIWRIQFPSIIMLPDKMLSKNELNRWIWLIEDRWSPLQIVRESACN